MATRSSKQVQALMDYVAAIRAILAPYEFCRLFLERDQQCTFQPAPERLVTGYIPYLDESKSQVLNGEVTLVIKSPLVTNRLDATITMYNEDGSCTYPGRLWTKTITGCNDTFVASYAVI